MKPVLLVCVLCISTALSAQITISSNDMPSVNDTVRYSFALSTNNDPALTGTNYTWDYSLLSHVNQTLDTFKPVNSTPLLYQFYFNNQILYPAHKANYAIKGNDFNLAGFFSLTNVYDYFKNDNSAYKNVGYGATINGIPVSVRNIPIDTVYKFPLNFGDVYNSYSESELTVPNLFTYKQKKWRSAIVEGWGTLITPYGTFQTIKVKFDIDITDSIYFDTLGMSFNLPRPTETQYHWLAQGEDVPVLQISTIAGNINNIQYKDIYRPLGINDNPANNKLVVYPNPADNVLNVWFDKPVIHYEPITIYDSHGKIIHSSFLTPGSSNFLFDISSFNSGIYLIHVNGITKRFVKQY